MINIYNNNMSALEKIAPTLHAAISTIRGNERFDLKEEKNNTFIITDNEHNGMEVNAHSLIDLPLYKEYLYLYLYGIADTKTLAALLANQPLQHIVIIEPELELIYIAFHLLDCSVALQTGILTIIWEPKLNTELYTDLVYTKKAKFYSKSYTLLVATDYYEKIHHDAILKTNEGFINAIQFVISLAGNCVVDSLVGIKHTIQNLHFMLSNPNLNDFTNQITKTTSVIVSTGPSLAKQLPALYKIQEYVTIISVDASLPILEKYNIRPDFVISMERVEASAKFFLNTTQEFLKKTITLHAVMQHKTVTDTTTDTPRAFFLRPLDYNVFFDFPEYGHLGGGLSAANAAHDLAFRFQIQTCILIGQDLAYSKDGKSHSSGHVFGEDEVKVKANDFLVEAYGGDGEIKTNEIWKIFLNRFEQSSTYYEKYGMITVDATEGGARIHGAYELSFEEAIEKYVDQSDQKSIIECTPPLPDVMEKNLALARSMFERILKEGKELQEEIEKTFLLIADNITPYEQLSYEEIKLAFNDQLIIELLDAIESIRNKIIFDEVYKNFMHQTIESMLLPYEMELGNILIQPVTSSDENKLKSIQWIFTHKHYLFKMAAAIHNILIIVEENNPFIEVDKN